MTTVAGIIHAYCVTYSHLFPLLLAFQKDLIVLYDGYMDWCEYKVCHVCPLEMCCFSHLLILLSGGERSFVANYNVFSLA